MYRVAIASDDHPSSNVLFTFQAWQVSFVTRERERVSEYVDRDWIVTQIGTMAYHLRFTLTSMWYTYMYVCRVNVYTM